MTVTLSGNGCDVVAGRWVDIYTGSVFTDPSLLDVDHMVPLADAHRSGGAVWDAARKAVYANDLALADALIAVSASANRSKSDLDRGEASVGAVGHARREGSAGARDPHLLTEGHSCAGALRQGRAVAREGRGALRRRAGGPQGTVPGGGGAGHGGPR